MSWHAWNETNAKATDEAEVDSGDKAACIEITIDEAEDSRATDGDQQMRNECCRGVRQITDVSHNTPLQQTLFIYKNSIKLQAGYKPWSYN